MHRTANHALGCPWKEAWKNLNEKEKTKFSKNAEKFSVKLRPTREAAAAAEAATAAAAAAAAPDGPVALGLAWQRMPQPVRAAPTEQEEEPEVAPPAPKQRTLFGFFSRK